MTTIDLSAVFASIEAALQRLNRQTLMRSLQSGLEVGTVRSSLGTIGLASVAELEALYIWRNGTSTVDSVTLDDIHLFPGFYLLSIQDSVANYKAFVSDSRWRPEWLPIFANGGGDFYVIELNRLSASPVRHFRIDEAEHPVEFGSLGAMLATIARAYEQGIFFVDPSGYLEMDDLVFGALAAEMNQDVDWWRG